MLDVEVVVGLEHLRKNRLTVCDREAVTSRLRGENVAAAKPS